MAMTGPQRKGKLVENGVSITKIARRLGVSRPLVSYEVGGVRHAQAGHGPRIRRAVARAIGVSVLEAFGDIAA